MSYVKVVVGLPLDGPFDYLVPAEFVGLITPGSRLRVSFGPRSLIAYAVGLRGNTRANNIKPVLKVIDTVPVLDSSMLALTKRLAEYYCCSWGEAIEAALPQELRTGRSISQAPGPLNPCRLPQADAQLIHAAGMDAKWEKYLEYIREALKNKASVLVLLTGVDALMKARQRVEAALGVEPLLLMRGERGSLPAWLKAREGGAGLIMGMRSAVFAPAPDLDLIIVDEEQDPVYKQEQAPHYHAREIALMRGEIEKIRVILGSISPSLESFYQAKKKKLRYVPLVRAGAYPQIKVLDSSRLFACRGKERPIFSKYLADCIYSACESKKRVLLFLNRRGFATYAACHNCGAALKCPRCNISLVFDDKKNVLSCHHCNFSMPPPRICPSCNAGYIKYSGTGTQKLEKALSAIFPRARIANTDGSAACKLDQADIFVATSSVFREDDSSFDLVGVLMIDNSLNRVDPRSGEKVFALLANLVRLSREKVIIETGFPAHQAIKAIESGKAGLFYAQELKQRRQSGFPPFRHMIILRVRGRSVEKTAAAAQRLFEGLSGGRAGGMKILSVAPGLPPKLRDNYYWQVLISALDPKKANVFLKKHLKNRHQSGIIVTVDVDPV